MPVKAPQEGPNSIRLVHYLMVQPVHQRDCVAATGDQSAKWGSGGCLWTGVKWPRVVCAAIGEHFLVIDGVLRRRPTISNLQILEVHHERAPRRRPPG